MRKVIQLGIVGCGNRALAVVPQFLAAAKGAAEVKLLYDVSLEALDKAKAALGGADIKYASSMEELAADANINMMMIFSPNAYHCDAIIAGLKAGKKVFSEKPLATTLEDCARIIEAEKSAVYPVMTGFVLRYSPLYRKIKELLDSGTFGKIINIAASENREAYGGGNSMSADYGWRRSRDKSGPYLLEKCSHDLDLLNWFAGSIPEKVAAFCGLDYFIPEHKTLWDKYEHDNFAKFVPEKNRINPFLSAKDIYDNHTIIMEYPNGIKMNFQLTLANAIPERRMYIACTEGTIIAEAYSGKVRYRRYDEEYETELCFIGAAGGHGGGDEVMAKELASSLLSGYVPTISGTANGLDCAKVALAADESVRSGKIIVV